MRRLALPAAALFATFAVGCDSGGADMPDAHPCFDCGIDGGGPIDAGQGDAGAMDGSVDPDGGPPASCTGALPSPATFDCAASDPTITFGDPIVADPMTWTWVGFDDAFCMNGEATGIGVSLNPASDRVMILLQGGGACFDPISCIGVANADGFDAAKFATYDSALSRGVFDRTDADNPMADWNMVFVPYCTGDVHGGTNEDGPSGRMHVGHRNMTAYLRRLVPTFAGATQVLLAGQSAGGLGTLVNYEQTQAAFDCTPVDVLDDAGSVLPEPYLRPCLQELVRETWGLNLIIPTDCSECACEDGSGLWNIAPYLAARHPDRRFGLVTSMEDSVFRGFYGYGYSDGCNFPATMPAADYAAGLNELRTALDATPSFQTYYVPGEQHTFTSRPLGDTSVGGTTLADWIGQLVDGDAAWTDVGP